MDDALGIVKHPFLRFCHGYLKRMGGPNFTHFQDCERVVTVEEGMALAQSINAYFLNVVLGLKQMSSVLKNFYLGIYFFLYVLHDSKLSFYFGFYDKIKMVQVLHNYWAKW